jgi:S-adenosylmethionine:tRNA ribosyltransferase-isomerase
MIAADKPMRAADAKLLYVAADGSVHHGLRTDLVKLLRRGDVVVANDAATLPASLHGVHERTGAPIEVRLAGRTTSAMNAFVAVVFGSGDYRIRTEDRELPPTLLAGDVLALGPLQAVVSLLDHPRLVSLRFVASTAALWEGIAHHGRPIQYAHVGQGLELWDVWTAIAGPPVAYEAPSAGFALDWRTVAAMRGKGVKFATLTHAAGISSTGDPVLDARLPFDEPYYIPETTAVAIDTARVANRRVVAIGTTVVRALEHAGNDGVVAAGAGIANQRIGAADRLRIVDAIVSGTHEAGTSHYELLRAFVDDSTLQRADAELEAHSYRTHEFGDSIFVERRLALPDSAWTTGSWRRESAAHYGDRAIAQVGAK